MSFLSKVKKAAKKAAKVTVKLGAPLAASAANSVVPGSGGLITKVAAKVTAPKASKAKQSAPASTVAGGAGQTLSIGSMLQGAGILSTVPAQPAVDASGKPFAAGPSKMVYILGAAAVGLVLFLVLKK